MLSLGNTLPGGSVVPELFAGGVGDPLDGFAIGVDGPLDVLVGVPLAPFDVSVGVLLCAGIEIVMGGDVGA